MLRPVLPLCARFMNLDDLFPGAIKVTHRSGEADLFCRVGGEGPPLLLLHGFPQTHAMWHAVYPFLSRSYTCVMPDLRGYGRSSAPPSGDRSSAYSKRRMAADMVSLMNALGHQRFAVVGHDRGGRVAYRLALDHPASIARLAVLDIVPTHAVWSGLTPASALRIYHWLFLAQPHPLPEMLIGNAPDAWLDHTIASWTASKSLSVFHPVALDDYRTCFRDPDRLRAACDDYRAGAGLDFEHDAEDVDLGRRIDCPTFTLWGDGGIPAGGASPLDVWRNWCRDVSGVSVPGGHFVAEENPADTARTLLSFLGAG